MQLGERLRRYRLVQNNMTLKNVSNSTGLSVSFLSDIERGRTNPSIETIYKLAECYNVPIGDLLPEGIEKRKIPDSLKIVINDENISEEMVDLMLQIQLRSEKKFQTEEDWKQMFYFLKTILRE